MFNIYCQLVECVLQLLNNCATTLKCLLDAELPQKMSLVSVCSAPTVDVVILPLQEIIRNEIIEEVVVNLRQSLQNGVPNTVCWIFYTML